MSLAPGQILDGKYRIVRVLGTGGMGAVYEGENTRIHRKVAIKVLHAEVARKADIVQRFEREAQAAGRIGSEHIVEVLDLGTLPTGERFMVMEFLDGMSLTERIKRRGRLAPEELLPLLLQLLEGLGAAHQAGIVHRDLKPDNIYIVRKGASDFVKILDFGVSKFSAMGEDFSMTKTGAVMGTPYYMSPEQARGQAVDARSDLYSVGVVTYQAFAGRVPFQAETFNELIFKIALEAPPPIETVVQGFDPQLAALVRTAMERDPTLRFQSAADFHRALSVWGSARATGAAPQGYSSPQGYPAAPGPGYPGAGQTAPAISPGGSAQQFAPAPGGLGASLAQSQSAVVVPAQSKSHKGTVIAAIAATLAVGGLAAAVLTRALRSDGSASVTSSAQSKNAAQSGSSSSPSNAGSSQVASAEPSASAPTSAEAPVASTPPIASQAPAATSATPPSAVSSNATSGNATSGNAAVGKEARSPTTRPSAPTAKPQTTTTATPPKTGSGRVIDGGL